MAIAQITTGVTLDQYDKEQRLIAETGEEFPGRLLQVCFGDPDNLTVVTVYESTADTAILDQTEHVHGIMLDPVQNVQAPARALLDQAPWAVRRVIGAINSGDTQRLLDFFPEEVRLLESGEVFSGRARIREFSDRKLIGAKGYLDVRQVARHEDTVTVAGPYHSQRFNGPVRFVFTTADDRIIELSIENDQEPAWLS
jgi:hypothetical protein